MKDIFDHHTPNIEQELTELNDLCTYWLIMRVLAVVGITALAAIVLLWADIGMKTIIVSVVVILALAGLFVAIWSLINTRDKYFKEYKERKRD